MYRIITTGQPVHTTPRRLSPDKLKIAKAEFQRMLDLTIIHQSSTPWALHMVPKSAWDVIHGVKEKPAKLETLWRLLIFE